MRLPDRLALQNNLSDNYYIHARNPTRGSLLAKAASETYPGEWRIVAIYILRIVRVVQTKTIDHVGLRKLAPSSPRQLTGFFPANLCSSTHESRVEAD